jgi:hypothetical protein
MTWRINVGGYLASFNPAAVKRLFRVHQGGYRA